MRGFVQSETGVEVADISNREEAASLGNRFTHSDKDVLLSFLRVDSEVKTDNISQLGTHQILLGPQGVARQVSHSTHAPHDASDTGESNGDLHILRGRQLHGLLVPVPLLVVDEKGALDHEFVEVGISDLHDLQVEARH